MGISVKASVFKQRMEYDQRHSYAFPRELAHILVLNRTNYNEVIMSMFHLFIKEFNSLLWSLPMIVLLMGTHLFYTIRLKFVQKKVGRGIHLSVQHDGDAEGDVSAFATLTTTLAATLGTGNIVGISTAVALGGPGSIFWCWLTGVLGMATTYAECYLSFLYRTRNEDGSYSGGPMYILEHALGLKPLSILFCICTIFASFGVGCSTQAKAITETAQTLWGWNPYIVGMIAALITGLVIIGGVKKISSICMRLVPTMGAFYIAGCLIILAINRDSLLSALILIIQSAFQTKAVAGGFIASTFMMAARQGIAKGLFTNEAGLGSAGITAAASQSSNPERIALVSMTATFWDTVVMCAITGLVIVSTIIKNPKSIEGYSFAEYTTAAFDQIPYVGTTILGISIICFAMATLIGWSYFGEKAVHYLVGPKGISYYHLVYMVAIFVGSILSLELVWDMTDTFNALMALPNILVLLLLYKKVE